MKTCRRSILLSCLLAGSVVSTVFPQDYQPIDLNLSLLRGVWETHTYRTKFTMNFLSDTKMAYERRAADYQLSPTILRIHTDDGELSYRYGFKNNELVIVTESGETKRLKRDRYGWNEESVTGKYYSFDSSDCEELIALNENGTFHYSKHCMIPKADSKIGANNLTEIERLDGVYRLEDSFVILCIGNQEVLKARVGASEEDGKATEIVFDGKLFSRDLDNKLRVSLPIVVYDLPIEVPCTVCCLRLPPPCLNCNVPSPPDDDSAPVFPVGGGSTPTPTPAPERNHRDTGPTRGDSGSNLTDSGPRPGGRRPQ